MPDPIPIASHFQDDNNDDHDDDVLVDDGTRDTRRRRGEIDGGDGDNEYDYRYCSSVTEGDDEDGESTSVPSAIGASVIGVAKDHDNFAISAAVPRSSSDDGGGTSMPERQLHQQHRGPSRSSWEGQRQRPARVDPPSIIFDGNNNDRDNDHDHIDDGENAHTSRPPLNLILGGLHRERLSRRQQQPPPPPSPPPSFVHLPRTQRQHHHDAILSSKMMMMMSIMDTDDADMEGDVADDGGVKTSGSSGGRVDDGTLGFTTDGGCIHRGIRAGVDSGGGQRDLGGAFGNRVTNKDIEGACGDAGVSGSCSDSNAAVVIPKWKRRVNLPNHSSLY